jgi:hypothetical protein
MLTWKRKDRPAEQAPPAPEPLGTERGLALAAGMGDVVTSLGCMTAQVGMLAQEVNRRLVGGAIADEQAAAILTKLHTAHQDIESACRLVGRVRTELAPPEPAAGHGGG